MSKIEVNQISSQCGSTLTIGQSGDTIQLACGATQTGFGKTGTVDWDTTAKTASFTAVSGNGYFVNTTSGAITLTLPASPSAGDIVAFKDYAGTFGTNNLTIGRNGSNLDGNAGDKVIDTNHTSMSLVYVDATQGWKSVEEGTGYIGENFPIATGGTVTTCGDYKIHTFTGPGTFTVCSVADTAANNIVDYLVVAGGAGAAGNHGGAGGAGGLRYYLNTTNSPIPAFPGSPINNFPSGTAVTITATSFPITVGGGGANGTSAGGSCTTRGEPGSNSVFSTITSTGGGGGGGSQSTPSYNGIPGGSGGGAGTPYPTGSPGSVGTGNSPPTTPAQGNNGGDAVYGSGWISAGGGGGAIQTGGTSPASPGAPGPEGLTTPAGLGGNGAGFTSNVFGSGNGECSSCVQYFAGGGGGGGSLNDPSSPTCVQNPAGGLGGGGNGAGNNIGAGQSATTNTGGGGGGGGSASNGGSGGSGIVIIRYKYQ